MRFKYAIIYVPDVAAAVAFYEKAFGLERRFLHESGQYAEMETGDTALAFADETMMAPSHSFCPGRIDAAAAGVEVGLVTEDVATAFDRAIKAGAKELVAPAVKPWGQTVSYVRDLNGFLVEICSPIG